MMDILHRTNTRANLRTNLDIDLIEKTKLKLNVLGILSETRTPGANGQEVLIYGI